MGRGRGYINASLPSLLVLPDLALYPVVWIPGALRRMEGIGRYPSADRESEEQGQLVAIRLGWLCGIGIGLSCLVASEGCRWQASQAGNGSEPLLRQEQAPFPSKSSEPGNRLDINAAGPRELESLPGIGPVLARRIVEFRAKNPPFRRVEEILIIRGIGRRKFEALRDRIQVADSTGQTPRPPRSAATESSR